MATQDYYNITTFDNTGAPDLCIRQVSEKIAQSWITELEREGIDFHLELVAVEAIENA